MSEIDLLGVFNIVIGIIVDILCHSTHLRKLSTKCISLICFPISFSNVLQLMNLPVGLRYFAYLKVHF